MHSADEEDHFGLSVKINGKSGTEFEFLLRCKIKRLKVLKQRQDLIRYAFSKDLCGRNVENRLREMTKRKQKHVGKRTLGTCTVLQDRDTGDGETA